MLYTATTGRNPDIAMPAGVQPALRGKENPVVVTVSVPAAEEEKPAAAPAAPAKKGKD